MTGAMSMYSQLLSSALEQAGWEGNEADLDTEGDILHRLEVYRLRLASGPTLTGEPAQDLAANLDYDLVLLRLCARRGIDASPEGFSRPLSQRQRLEAELRSSGVDVDALEDASWLQEAN
jgi:hypothetical protein